MKGALKRRNVWGRRRARLSSFRLGRRRSHLPSLIRLVVTVVIAALGFAWFVRPMNAVPEHPSPVVQVYRHDLDRTVSMDLEEYVKGVVAAEMPVSFHLEALKAQAVAARTLALRLIKENAPLSDHSQAVISTNPATHQAWVSEDELRDQWGVMFIPYWSKITRAVSATRGLVVVYDGELIFPAYHSSSGGQTEDSEKYWTGYMPYLRSVPDPYVAGSRFEETVATYTKQDVAKTLGLAVPVSTSELTVEVVSRFPSGRVQTVRVGSETMSGRQLRERLGLRSNWFEVDDHGNELVFRVRGYGHGVGMSQYGADGMGRAGFTFDQILTHYYTGVEVVGWYD